MSETMQNGGGLTTVSATGARSAPHRLVTAPIAGDGYLIEVREYRCSAPADKIYDVIDNHLEFTLSPFGWRGGYPEVSDELQPIGQVMLAAAGHPFRATHQAGAKRALVCTFSGSRLQAFGDLNWRSEDLARSIDIRSPRLEYVLSSLMEEAFSPGIASDVLVEAAMSSVLVELLRYFGETPEPGRNGGLTPWQLRLIREEVEEATGPSRTIAELGAECGLSSRQLMRSFKATTGQTLGSYIQTSRLGRAKRLLSATDRMIKQAAFECGFETAAAFAAAFRKATGMTPKEYRRLMRAGG